MPKKKHTPSYAQAKPSYVHPSLQSSSPSSSSASSEPASVNQRLQQLRREQAPKAPPSRRDEITEVVTSRTVPPHLRRILQMPEVDAPKPKPGTRATRPSRQGGVRPPPGPAAPSSWLETSPQAHIRTRKKGVEGPGSRRLCALAVAHHREFQFLPHPRSLQHECIRTFVQNWDDLVEYEQHYLHALPQRLKEAMLSYLSLYGSRLSFKSFKILFQGDPSESEGASGSDSVNFLDLTRSVNKEMTLKDLEKCLQRPASNIISVMSGMSLNSNDSSSNKGKEKTQSPEVAESWEDEADEDPALALPATLNIPLFPHLTRLSLARPENPSWTDLLTLSSKLNKITHLSLAYWPRPSTTPNAATTSMVSEYKSVNMGGSHYYSDMDDDWQEAANILRRLSLNTYCLKWLDLEGCTWHKALTWRGAGSGAVSEDADSGDWRSDFAQLAGPDFSASWRQIEYLNLFQGCVPSNTSSLRTIPAGVVPMMLLTWLLENRYKEEVQEKLDPDPSVAYDWVDREIKSREVGTTIQSRRREAQGAWCRIDYGWGDQ